MWGIFLFGGLVLAAILWFWPEENVEKTPVHPSRIATEDLPDERILSQAVPSNPLESPDALKELMFSSKPLEPRRKWSASLSVLVIDAETQRPIPGVKVTIQGPITLPEAWTDTDGNAMFLQLPAGGYYCHLTHDRFAMKERTFLDSIRVASGEHKEVLLEMGPACMARGRILDARTGEPVSGAEIFPNRYEENPPTRSGSDGRFSVPTGETGLASIYIKKKGYAPREVFKSCTGLELDLGDFLLTAAWTLKGRVVDSEGEPIAGVQVQDYARTPEAAPPSNLLVAKTDSNGRFRLSGLPPTSEIIYFYHEDYADETAKVSIETPPGFEIVMQRACRLEGVVRDQNGRGLEGVTVIPMDFQSLPALTDESGAFILEKVRPGEIDLGAIYWFDGGTAHETRSVTCPAPSEGLQLTISIDRDAAAEGVVVDESDVPVAKALIFVMPDKRQDSSRMSMKLAYSDDDGAFKIVVPAEGGYRLSVFSHERRLHRTTESMEGGQDGLRIMLESFSQPQFVKELPETGEVYDLSGRLITDYEYCWSVCHNRIRADAEGRWTRDKTRWRDMPPLWIFLPDGRVGRWSGVGGETGEDNPVTVGAGGSLSGKLGDSFPDGLSRVQLGPYNLQDRIVEREFLFPLLPPGYYTLEVTASSGRKHFVNNIQINDGVPVDLGTLELNGEEEP